MNKPVAMKGMDVSPEVVRCAATAVAEGAKLAATAGVYDGYLAIEWPPPWPRDVKEIRALDAVVKAAAASGIRVQLIRPIGRPATSARHVILYLKSGSEWIGRLDRRELLVTADHVAAAAMALLDGDGEGGGTAGDVLLCTHGSRDACCGSLGMRLAAEAANEAVILEQPIRLWSTSHLGGHRFAPTCLVLPEAMEWGQLNIKALTQVLSRDGSPADVHRHLRGCSAIGSREGQLLDAVGLVSVGWDWLDHRRRVSPSRSGSLRLDAISSSGHQRAWEGVVTRGREIPTPVCRSLEGDSAATEFELELAVYSTAAVGPHHGADRLNP